jgi:hypothetical protein
MILRSSQKRINWRPQYQMTNQTFSRAMKHWKLPGLSCNPAR